MAELGNKQVSSFDNLIDGLIHEIIAAKAEIRNIAISLIEEQRGFDKRSASIAEQLRLLQNQTDCLDESIRDLSLIRQKFENFPNTIDNTP